VELADERLATGATLVLYDGSPFHPHPGCCGTWRRRSASRIFGTSAKYLAALQKSGFVPAQTVDLTALRTVLSTGSPLLPEGFDYVYTAVKADLQLASISGAPTSCRASRSDVRRARCIAARSSAADSAWRSTSSMDAGRPVRGERGELVCTAPFPSMPVGFWNDPTGAKYRAAYFERFRVSGTTATTPPSPSMMEW